MTHAKREPVIVPRKRERCTRVLLSFFDWTSLFPILLCLSSIDVIITCGLPPTTDYTHRIRYRRAGLEWSLRSHVCHHSNRTYTQLQNVDVSSH